jgi:hypothetical protein
MRQSTIERKIEKLNAVIELANYLDIFAIEPDSTWESVYEFDKIFINGKNQVVFTYNDVYKFSESKQVEKFTTSENSNCMWSEDLNWQFNYVKRAFRKAFKESGKLEIFESTFKSGKFEQPESVEQVIDCDIELSEDQKTELIDSIIDNHQIEEILSGDFDFWSDYQGDFLPELTGNRLNYYQVKEINQAVLDKVKKQLIEQPELNFESESDYTDFIKFVFIPDLRKSGKSSTANDLSKLIRLIRDCKQDKKFISFLTDILIPDLIDSGYHSTANDFIEGIYYLNKKLKQAVNV